MKKIFVFIVVIALMIAAVYLVRTNKKLGLGSKPIDTVFVGAKEYQESFDSAGGSAKLFYEKYRLALDNLETRNFSEAIKLFNECIPQAGIGIEKGMVYDRLAKIYRELNDLESELKYTELTIKFSANQVLNDDYRNRAIEIRQLLATKSEATKNAGSQTPS